MTDPRINAFGRLISDPDLLPREQRIDEVSRLAGGLLAGNPDPAAARWLGQKLQNWLNRGGKLEWHLGVAPSQGSHRTAQNIVARKRRDALVVRFANEVGNDQKAISIISGAEPCSINAASTFGELKALGKLPKGRDAITRARRAVLLGRRS